MNQEAQSKRPAVSTKLLAGSLCCVLLCWIRLFKNKFLAAGATPVLILLFLGIWYFVSMIAAQAPARSYNVFKPEQAF
jgi:MFS-type transporter involved in bile tolerance (Atg22 family)